MTPPTEHSATQTQQLSGVQSVESIISPAPIQEPVQPVITEQNNNVAGQPVNLTPIETPSNINQPTMTLNQSINSQMGEMPINGQSAVTPQQPPIQPIQNMVQSNSFQAPLTATTMQNEETEPKKKKNSPILVALLIMALLAIVGFEVIYFVKPFDKKDNNETTNNENQEVLTPEENNNYANWMNYILDQNITSIILERIPLEGEKKTAKLINDNLSDIFSKLTNYQLIKRYYEGAGMADGDILTITYTKDDISYEVKITNGILWADSDSLKDSELRNILEESEYTTENEELKDKDGALYNYVFDNYDSTILDEFFVSEKIEETE